MTEFIPSKYQQAIFEFVQRGTGHAFVDAAAGSGKTTTLIQASKLLPYNCKAIFLAFNKHIAEELKVKLAAEGSSMQAMTIHQLGMQALRQLGVRLNIDASGKKYNGLCKQYLISWGEYEYKKQQTLKKLVSFAQLTLSETDEASLKAMAEHYDLEITNDEWPLLWPAVAPILKQGLEMAKAGDVDFNDMVWVPCVLKLAPAQADYIFVDESQDLNAAQLTLVKMAVNGHGRLLFVGDKRQSLYGFAGADTESVNKIIKSTNATVLPLSICYRCPKSHVDMCADIYPGIEAAPDAPEGIVGYVHPDKLFMEVKPGDLVLCRTTAPLVSSCLTLIREGVRAKVRGRDIGKNFADLLEKLAKSPTFHISKFSAILSDYRLQQALIIGTSDDDADMKLAALDDKVDTMQALYGAYLETTDTYLQSLDGFKNYITDFFTDETGSLVIFSTVHKAKGLEENRVFILKPELMPHPKAKRGWQLEQEYNIKYVALSRAKYDLKSGKQGELYFVTPIIPEFDDETEEQEATPAASESVKVETRGRKKLGRHHVHMTIDQKIFDAVQATGNKDLGKLVDGLLAAWLEEQGPTSEPPSGNDTTKEASENPSEASQETSETPVQEETTVDSSEEQEAMPEPSQEPETLFADTDTEHQVIRIFFTCKTRFPKRCGHVWVRDYMRESFTSKLYRYDESGSKVWFENDKKACPECGKPYIHCSALSARHSNVHKCNEVCKNAKGAHCDCSCGGANHGINHMLGKAVFEGNKNGDLLTV